MPVTKEDSSDARNKAAPATSSEVARRCSGMLACTNPRTFSDRSSEVSRPKNLGNIGVSVGPGQITLTRIPFPPKLSAMDFAVNTTAPLVAEYHTLRGEPTMPEVEEVKMTDACGTALLSRGIA